MEGQGCLNILVVCGRNDNFTCLVGRGGNVLRSDIGNFSSILIKCQPIHHITVKNTINIVNHSAFGYRFLREKVCRPQSTGLRGATFLYNSYLFFDSTVISTLINGKCRASADIIVSTGYIRNFYSSGTSIRVILIRNTILFARNHRASILYSHSRLLGFAIICSGIRNLNGRICNFLTINSVLYTSCFIPYRNRSPISTGIGGSPTENLTRLFVFNVAHSYSIRLPMKRL